MSRVVVFCLLSILAVGPALGEGIDCKDAMTQNDLNRCADDDYRTADADLNRVWKQARATAKAADDALEADFKGAEKALLNAQRAWIAYRDGQCELAGFAARGGTMEPMVVSGCLADLTRARSKELNDFVGSMEGR